MKIVYQNVIWLLFFVAYNYMSLADDQKIEVDVVAFFDEENEQKEIAFKTAVSNFNRFEDAVQYNESTYIIEDTDFFKKKNFMCNFTEFHNLGGVICPTSPKIAPLIESFCSNLEIPAVQVNWRPSPVYLNNSLVVNFFPDTSRLFHGLGVIVKNLQWRSIVIFYENAENLVRLQDILKIQDSDGNAKQNTVIVKELGPGPDYRSVLKQIQNISEHRIVLDCRTENIINIMKQAKELNLLEKPFSYFLTSLDAHTLDLDVLETEANITTVRVMDPTSGNFLNALSKWNQYLDANNLNIRHLDQWSIKTETALMYDGVNIYLHALKDLHVSGSNVEPRHLSCDDLSDKWENGFGVAAFLRKRTCESSNCIVSPMSFDNYGRRKDFTLYIVEGNRDDVSATWNSNDPERITFLKSEEDRNKALEEKWSRGEVTVGSIILEPYLMLKPKRPDGEEPWQGNSRYEGFAVDLINELAQELKIRHKFLVRDDIARGNYNEKTKSWNGLVRDILDRKVDLAICDFTITPERRGAVDFSTPFMRVGISILYKKPDAKQADLYAFLDPFSFGLWIYSATLYLAMTVALYFIARLSPGDWENPHPCNFEPEELENIWDMKNCLWLTLGSIMNQGCDILPKGCASRMVVVMWWFYAFIVTNSYMANLAAFLTNERSQGSINSAEDLSKQTKVKYGTWKGGSTEAFFRKSNYSTYQRMWTNMQQTKPSVFEPSNDAGVARVKNTKERGYAFLMESALLEYEIQKDCELMQVGAWLDSKSYGIGMPLDYPHRSRINEALLTLQERGRITELKQKWWKPRGNKTACEPAEPTDASASKLALENVGGVFMVLGIGVALGYVVAICEFLWNVRNVSVEEHISFLQALKVELLFALNVRISKKRVKPQISESSSSSSRSGSRSVAHSILRGAGSFFGLDIVSKAGTPGSSRPHSRVRD